MDNDGKGKYQQVKMYISSKRGQIDKPQALLYEMSEVWEAMWEGIEGEDKTNQDSFKRWRKEDKMYENEQKEQTREEAKEEIRIRNKSDKQRGKQEPGEDTEQKRTKRTTQETLEQDIRELKNSCFHYQETIAKNLERISMTKT